MNNQKFNDEYESPIIRMDQATGQLSKRKYLLVLTSLILVGFLAIMLGYQLTGTNELTRSFGGLYTLIGENWFAIFIGSFIVSIAGIIVMMVGRRKGSVPVTAVGYAMLILSFGLTIGFLLQFYKVSTIFMAMLITLAIFVVFSVLGFIFPSFFAKIQGILLGLLIPAIVVSLVFMFLGYHPAWLDIVIILIFCGFIGYDMYKAMTDEPTYANALFYAADLYLDIINIFLRVLSLLSRK